MAHVQKINDVPFVFGLKWSMLGLVDGLSVSKEKNIQITEEAMEYGFFYNYAEITCLGLTSKTFKGNVAAARAAILLTEHDNPTIFHVELEGDQFWFVAISGGAVVQGTDVVGDSEAIDEIIADFEDYDDYAIINELDFTDEQVKRAKKEFKVKKLTINIKAPVIACLVLIAGAYVYNGYQEEKAAEAAAELTRLQELARLNSTTVADIKQIDDKSLTKRFTTRIDGDAFIVDVEKLYATKGGLDKGWELEVLTCDQEGCYFDYLGRPYALFSDIPNTASFQPGTKAYSLVRPLNSKHEKLKGTKEAPSCKAFSKDIAGILQNSAYIKGIFNTPEKKEGGGLSSFSEESRLKYGSFKVNGRYFDMGHEFMSSFTAFENVVVKNMSIKKSNTWIVSGEYICIEY